MDQQRTFPRIYSPHLIDYFRTWGFKAGQEFLTWRSEPGVPGYTALPEEDTLVGELFCLRLRVSPGEQQKDPIGKGWSLRGLSGTLDLQEPISIQLHFLLVYSTQGSFPLKDHGIICLKISQLCFFVFCSTKCGEHVHSKYKASPCTLKPVQTHQGDLAGWSKDTSLEDPVRDTHKVLCRDKNVSRNPIFSAVWMTHAAKPDFGQWTVRELRILLQTGGFRGIFLDHSGDDLTSESDYVTLVGVTNYSGSGPFEWNHHFKALVTKYLTKTIQPFMRF